MKKWFMGGAAVLAAAFLLACGGAGSSADRPMGEVSDGNPGVTQAAPAEVKPVVASFVGVPKISEKQCFGSAGCHVQFTVAWSYKGTPLSDDTTWRLTYEVAGVTDGPLVATAEVTGTKYEAIPHFVTVPSERTKLKVRPVSVEDRGF